MKEETAAIQYIGQVGFILRRNGFTVAIDPYLTDSVDRLVSEPADFWKRNYPPPVQPGSLTDIDLVLITHEHLDHMDPETLLAIADASPRCRIAAPRICIPMLREVDIEEHRLVALKHGAPMLCESGLIIRPIPAWHEAREVDSDGWDRFLGYMLEWDGFTIYHAGDTLATEQLITILNTFDIDVGMLPINGRDLFRERAGVVGNMNAREAAALAWEVKMDMVVPLHFDMYPNNSEGISGFVEELYTKYRGLKYHIFQPGETLVYYKNSPHHSSRI
ncbi:L-ascorbate metabolism protein UlaG (beta-lactamase superfamily) [Paenibacillus taihuensis]|uniref:L-ascorbate metabolism protein UlaG (Beta-lactamase superfamily) n=1 Tax=Paenibacillus taihuensis TaxID=1156355 RepID=A0A3D9RMR4_9BACL|nr:MBL fold metallo-hydrolase [Paenibacillus taihuensis]REE81183.1 L-ascorbate metabolism protein UlaG (beta-lactamase superfamily) [Paenibacillus taihuensis]